METGYRLLTLRLLMVLYICDSDFTWVTELQVYGFTANSSAGVPMLCSYFDTSV